MDAVAALTRRHVQRERRREVAVGPGEVGQQLGADREQVAPGQLRDLRHAAEAGAHHLGGVAMLLVIRVDAAHRLDARVLRVGNLAALRLAVVVVDASDEGRDQRHACLGARYRLGETEKQRQIAVDTVFLEQLGGADAFPRAADLHEHAVRGHASRRVEGDDLARLPHRGHGIETVTGVDFGRHAARHDPQDLAAEGHGQSVHEGLGARRPGESRRRGRRQRAVDQVPVLRLLGRLQQQRRIGRRILRAVLTDGVDVAGIGDDHGVALQGVEQGHRAILPGLGARGQGLGDGARGRDVSRRGRGA